MTLGPFTEKHPFPFVLCDTAPNSLLGRNLLPKFEGLICSVSAVDLTLELRDQTDPDLLCSIKYVLDIEEEEFQQVP